MAGGIQLGAGGVQLGAGGVVLADSSTACCCAPGMICMVQFSVEWDCGGPLGDGSPGFGAMTHGSKVCKDATTSTAWVRTAGPRCIYTKWVASGSSCTTDSDCSGDSIPADPTFPWSVSRGVGNAPDDCLPTYPDWAGCPTTYTVTVSGTTVQACYAFDPRQGADGTFDLTGGGGYGYDGQSTDPVRAAFGTVGGLGFRPHPVFCGVWVWCFSCNTGCCDAAFNGDVFFFNLTQSTCVPLSGWFPAATGDYNFYFDGVGDEGCIVGGALTVSTP